MQLDISPLPQNVQRILHRAMLGEPITLVKSGKIIGNLGVIKVADCPTDDRHAYDYDVQAMQQSIDSGKILVPDFENDNDFLAWLNG